MCTEIGSCSAALDYMLGARRLNQITDELPKWSDTISGKRHQNRASRQPLSANVSPMNQRNQTETFAIERKLKCRICLIFPVN
jgi:hypothetical protein